MKTELIQLIDKNNIISFDVFDTLLFRNVSKPTDIFKIMEIDVKEKYGIDSFCDKRIKAESDSRKESDNQEVNLEEIYSFFECSKNARKEILQLELDKELEFICANPFMKSIFDYCVEKKKKIYLISDMYLSSNFIKKLLEKAGYKNIPKIYVSNEHKCLKGDGTLFTYVKENEKLDTSKWLHIGDNYVSDYKSPKKVGLSAYNYKNINNYDDNKSKSVFESIFLAMRNNLVYSGEEIDYYKEFAIKYISSIYFGFTNFVYLNNKESDNVYFLARDGYIIKKLYELFPKINKQELKYLYLSRKSMQVPSLYYSSKERLVELLISGSNDMPIGKLLKNAYIDTTGIDDKLLKLYGFDNLEDKINDENSYGASKLLAHLLKGSEKKYEELYELAKAYLNQEGLNNYENINVVDVGWAGSLQDSLRNILNKTVTGYYFGTIDAGFDNYKIDSYGYAFDLGEPYDMMKSINQKNVMMYELIFSAPHGSTVGYKKEKNKIVPILKENDDFLEFIEKIQNASYEFIKNVLSYYKYFDSFSSNFAVSFYEEFLAKKNYDDLIVFDKISNDCFFASDDKIPYVFHVKKEEILNKKNYKELAMNLSNENPNRRFNQLWYQAYLIDGVNTKEEYDSLKEEFDVYLKDQEISIYLDKYYDEKEDYYKELKKIIKLNNKNLSARIVNEYYLKYHPNLMITLRRRLIPYKFRKIIKKTINIIKKQ